MYFVKIPDNGNRRTLTDMWMGLNHKYKIADGELFDCENVSADLFPVLSTRGTRVCITNISEDIVGGNVMRGLINVGGDVYCLEGNYLWNASTNVKTDLSDLFGLDTSSNQTMLVMGSYLLMFPSKTYINLLDVTEYGSMESKYEVGSEGVAIDYTPCSLSGAALQGLTASFFEPSSPSSGDYWICTNPDKEGLYIYSPYTSTFEPVATSHIKIEISGVDFRNYFDVGDAVFMNSSIGNINEGSIIEVCEDGYIVVSGFMDSVSEQETTSSLWKWKAERRVPDMDYVCVDKNRVWGCRYGHDSGSHKIVNEVYASKLGDFKNFYVYEGLATDSYALTIGEMGKFTGCISYQGYPTFFKENRLYRIYGSMPSEYSLNELSVPGVQVGSSKSLVIVGEYLLYKGVFGVYIFDGSRPQLISGNLGREMKYDAVAGGNHNKYYVEMRDILYNPSIFVYDTENGLWMKESPLNAKEFSVSQNGDLFAITSYNLWGLGDKLNSAYARAEVVDEDFIEWFAESGDLGLNSPEFKYVDRISLRAYVPFRSEIRVKISYNGRPFEEVGCIRGNDDLDSQSLTINPFRCDNYRIRLEGHGMVRIYSLATTMDTESEDNEHYI